MESYFNGIRKHSETLGELNYVIPKSETANMKTFFLEFDKKLDEYNIKSYGVTMATLEEVFLKINTEFDPDEI